MTLKKNEYQCARCNGIFEKVLTDEEAQEEYIETFGEDFKDEEKVIVCDDCFNEMKWFIPIFKEKHRSDKN